MTDLRFVTQIRESIETKQRLLRDCLGEIEALCDLAAACCRNGGKLMLCGNGGSASDAAHAVGELMGWFEDRDREGIPAIAIGQEVPSLTAIANDASYDAIFARQVRALGRPEDLLIGISTSGRSRNVVAAMEAAKSRGTRCAALCSVRGGPVAELAEVAVRVPSESTPRIQECHILILHLLCSHLERALRPA